MTKPGKIAVVVTCFDLGRTLREALQSIRAQTSRVAEIVVVDDGSTDPYTRSELAAIEESATVLRLEHGGPARARNAGIERTISPLVVLLDGDDAFASTYLEKAGALLDARPDLSFVSCGLQAFGNASYRWTPPPYTVAESLARGACGHISTVFRRDVWETVGGFDPSLPAYEDLDFWLSVLEHGYRGEIIDEPLLRYRVRSGSRYHRAISREIYARAKKAILLKHRVSVEAEGSDVFGLMLEFEKELRAHSAGLRRQRSELQQEIGTLRSETIEASTAVRQAGSDLIDWGDDLRAALQQESRAGLAGVHSHYVATFLRANRSSQKGRVLTIRNDNAFPGTEDRWDTIIVIDAFAQAPEPRRSLEACRGALDSGGVLLAVFSCIPLDAERDLRVFTEASARALACSVFDPAQVEVTVYGNLRAGIASAARAEISSEELAVVDPTHPVTVGICGRVSGRPRVRGRVPAARKRAPRQLGRKAGAVLVYHRVAESPSDPHRLCVSPDTLRAHMEGIRGAYTPVSLGTLARAVLDGEIPEGAVAVTFDDGYLDNLVNASPILSELDIPATFFVCTDRLNEKHEHWWDVVERVLLDQTAPPKALRIRTKTVGIELETRTSDQRQAALMALHGALLGASPEERCAIVSQVVDWKAERFAPRNSHRVMTTTELGELTRRSGHELGVHTTHHLMLTAHPESVRRFEMLESKIALEEISGKRVTAVSYPYGVTDLATTLIAEELGFESGYSVDPDIVTAQRDPLRLPRLDLSQLTEMEFTYALERALAR